MPSAFRLAPVACGLRTYDDALAALSSVRPIERSTAPLLLSPEEYLAKVRSTLVFMKAHY